MNAASGKLEAHVFLHYDHCAIHFVHDVSCRFSPSSLDELLSHHFQHQRLDPHAPADCVRCSLPCHS